MSGTSIIAQIFVPLTANGSILMCPLSAHRNQKNSFLTILVSVTPK